MRKLTPNKIMNKAIKMRKIKGHQEKTLNRALRKTIKHPFKTFSIKYAAAKYSF